MKIVTRPDPFLVAAELRRTKYPQAQIFLLGGSAAGGELTPHSDLDVVVLYGAVPHARRESFVFKGWPVEAFVHDPETLNYFFRTDAAGGDPVALRMAAESVAVPEPDAASRALQEHARTLLAAGPPPLGDDEERRLRYMLTSLTTDLRRPRGADETTATGAALYELVARYFLRTRGLWAASGKMVPRRLRAADAEFYAKFCLAFDELFANRPGSLTHLVEELVAPRGGLLFDGYQFNAPSSWRIPAGDP